LFAGLGGGGGGGGLQCCWPLELEEEELEPPLLGGGGGGGGRFMPGGGGGGPPLPVVAAGALARPMESRKLPEPVRHAKVCPIRIFLPLLRRAGCRRGGPIYPGFGVQLQVIKLR